MKKTYGTQIYQLFQRKTKFVTFLLICVVMILPPLTSTSFSTPAEQGGWKQLESGVTQDLNSVSFICLNRGSVVGDEGVILRTGDGGDNWTAQDSGVPDTLYDIFYYDYSITLAVGEGGTILFTNNSGQNWTVVQTGMIGSYFSGQMISDTIGVAVGVNAIFQPFFTRTTDGWDTFESTSFYIEHDDVYYEGWLSDVFFINASVGFATAVIDMPVGGAVVRTLDGGQIWETVFFSDNELFGIDFTWEGIGYAVGNHGVILQTLDDGETWNNLESGVDNVLHAIDFSSEEKGTAVGDNGVILRTENEGGTWTQQISGTTFDLVAVRFVSVGFGIVVGENGLILRTTTGGYPEDIYPPETNCTLTGVLKDGIYISDVLAELTASDNISGVDMTSYKLDDGSWTTYVEPFVISTDGSHTLRFYSVDNAGNTEEEKTVEFQIQHPLSLTISITGGIGVRVTIQNTGISDLTNISWNFTLDGGIIILGKQKSGSIDIKTDGEVLLKFFVIGFGRPQIIFEIASQGKSVQSSLFLFFVRI